MPFKRITAFWLRASLERKKKIPAFRVGAVTSQEVVSHLIKEVEVLDAAMETIVTFYMYFKIKNTL